MWVRFPRISRLCLVHIWPWKPQLILIWRKISFLILRRRGNIWNTFWCIIILIEIGLSDLFIKMRINIILNKLGLWEFHRCLWLYNWTSICICLLPHLYSLWWACVHIDLLRHLHSLFASDNNSRIFFNIKVLYCSSVLKRSTSNHQVLVCFINVGRSFYQCFELWHWCCFCN